MATKDKGFLDALKEVGQEKGIAPEVLFEAVEAALVSAYKRNFNTASNVRVYLERATGEFHVYAQKKVVEKVENKVTEISLLQAQKQFGESIVLDDVVEVEVTPANFGRIAAQTAKQVVVQRIREAERGIIYEEYSNRSSDILTGTVQRMEGHNVFIDLGKTEAVLAPSEQISTEQYKHNDRIKVYVVEVKRTSKGPQILVSRTHPGLLKRLFELEVPEIQEGTVEIKSVAREPGMRSKIAVFSANEEIDPVGSCVGQKGLRVQAVVDELRGEKIDIVKWNEDPAKYIANSLSPAKVVSVAVNEEKKMSRVIVPDYQLSLAIGKRGQNARLAVRLTGWKIDIKSLSEATELGLMEQIQQKEELPVDETFQDEFAQEMLDNQEEKETID